MSYNVGGIEVKGVVVQQVEYSKQKAEQAVEQQIQEVIKDPTKTIRELQQPSGLSMFLDIKV